MNSTNYAELLRDQKATVRNMGDEQLAGELLEVMSELSPQQMQWLGKMIREASEKAIRRSVVQAHEDALMGERINETELHHRRNSFMKFARIGLLIDSMGGSMSIKGVADYFKRKFSPAE